MNSATSSTCDIFVTAYTPRIVSGRTRRTYGLLRAMSQRAPVKVLYVPFDGDRPDSAFSALSNVSYRAVVPSRGARRLAVYLSARLRGVPAGVARGVSAELAAAAAREACGASRVVADGPVAAAALMRLAATRPVVYAAHNLESDRDNSPHMRRFERALLERYAETWMCTQSDVLRARALAPEADAIRFAPNVVDVEAIDPVRRPSGDGGRVLVVADFSYAPNREGLDLVCANVFPKLHVWRPGATLTVVGRGLDDWRGPAFVERLGFVEDLDEVYRSVDVVLVPLLRGAGSPLKLIEGLAYGLPVVATAHASSLVDGTRDGHNVLVGRDADELAARLSDALGPGGNRIGSNGRRLALKCYSIAALVEALDVPVAV